MTIKGSTMKFNMGQLVGQQPRRMSHAQDSMYMASSGFKGDSGNRNNPDSKAMQLRRPSMAQAFANVASRKSMGNKPPEYFEHNNGWQMKSEKVLDRISCLFNCGTMSDVIFQVEGFEIPAHKLVLGASSPVFYSRFFETGRGKDLPQSRRHVWRFCGGIQRHGRTLIQIEDVPAPAFFEFLRFLYTDKLSVTLENVSSLMILADDFKVAGLTEVCMEYLSAMTSEPLAVLHILKILRNAFLKCIVVLWRDVTESHLEMRMNAPGEQSPKVRHSTLGDRQDYSEASTRASTRAETSRLSQHSPPGNLFDNHLSSLLPINRSSLVNYSPPQTADSTTPQKEKTALVSFELTKQSRQMSYKLGQVVQELEVLCWRCVDKETEKVLASDAFRDQDLSVLRAILNRHCASVPEIALFRAVNQWATHQCQKKGLPPTSENRRKFLGKEATQLLRFPAMTTEQLQREVVPTGLLDYTDVHSLLRYKDGCAQLVRFSAQQREGFEEADLPTARRPSLEPLRPQRAIYQAVPDDAVDTLLAAGLLRQHLRGGVGQHLPGIEALSGRKKTNTPLLRGCDDVKTKTQIAVYSQEAPKAEDFERLGPGLYRFKDRDILRMRIENGEVMVYDTEKKMEDLDPFDTENSLSPEGNADKEQLPIVRANSKISSKYRISSKVKRTLGIPLVSFLEGELV